MSSGNNTSGKRQKAKGKKIITLLLIGASALPIAYYLLPISPSDNNPALPITPSAIVMPSTSPKTVMRNFTGLEFAQFYNSYVYPATEKIEVPPVISGDSTADETTRIAAEARGYRLRSFPVVEQSKVTDDIYLQKLAATDWLKLEKAMQDNGLIIRLVAGYRSVDDQRQIFLSRSGDLATTSPPGYSRHHTGYTVDFGCGATDGGIFEYSACYEWLAKDNYKNAKEYGWMPSYPPGAGLQGPDPEPWEFVWVSRAAMIQ
jgi:LAS superfamily LD-carboxypeptidase LdcB